MCVCVCVCVCVCDVSPPLPVLLAGKPKKENALKTICLMLGPDYISDIIEVCIYSLFWEKLFFSINELY